jgi:hypothetical protein
VSQRISQKFLVTIVTLPATILPLQFSVIVVKTTPLQLLFVENCLSIYSIESAIA